MLKFSLYLCQNHLDLDVTLANLLANALARCKGLEEGEVTGQLFGRLTLMRANALMLSTRCQDADFPIPHVDSIEY